MNRGRKKLDEEGRLKSVRINSNRILIRNTVLRKYDGEIKCCICGKPNAEILHNNIEDENMYLINFLCFDCRKDPANIEKADKTRFDLRERLRSVRPVTSDLTNEQVKEYVDGYMKVSELKSIGDYCNEVGLSRYRFNMIIDRYSKLYNKHIKEILRNKASRIQKEKVRRIKGDF